MPEGSFTSSYLQHHGGDPYGTGVGVGTLSMNGQALAVTQATVATDFHEALNILRYFAVQVALSGEVSLDVVTKLGKFIFRKIVYAGIGVNTGFCEDLLGGGEANAVDIGQADFNALVARKVDTNETCMNTFPFSLT